MGVGVCRCYLAGGVRWWFQQSAGNNAHRQTQRKSHAGSNSNSHADSAAGDHIVLDDRRTGNDAELRPRNGRHLGLGFVAGCNFGRGCNGERDAFTYAPG